jgi:uncharacterized membrane protein YbhN (UPF0104 family)
MKNWFRYIFYASLIFLVIALVRADYLVVPDIHNYAKLGLSLALLFLGFLLNALSWPKVLEHTHCEINNRDGMASQGLSIFSKYIPGKLWVIMGRAEYLAKRYKYPRKDLTSLSLDAQFIALWAALLLGTIGMIAVKGTNIYGLSVLILFALLSLVIFTSLFHSLAENLLVKILKKEVKVPQLPFRKVIRALLWYTLSWGTWSLAFWFMASSLVEGSLPFSIAFAFALAGSIGILSVFAPGGLGVREGILIAFLTMAGIAVQDATTIAVTSRLWFLTGEAFIFLVAFFLDRSRRKQASQSQNS